MPALKTRSVIVVREHEKGRLEMLGQVVHPITGQNEQSGLYPIISFEARSIWVHQRFKTSTIEHEEGTPNGESNVGGGLRRVGPDRAMARTGRSDHRFRQTKALPLDSG